MESVSKMLLKYIYPRPLDEPVKSRDSSIYLFIVLRIAGLSVGKKFSKMRYFWKIVFFINGFFIVPVGFLLNFIIYFSINSPATLLQSLQLWVNSWCFVMKYLSLILNAHRFEMANAILDKVDRFYVTMEQKIKIREMVAMCNSIFIGYVVIYSLYVMSSIIDGLVNGHAPFNTYCPFANWRESRKDLYIQSLYEYAFIGTPIMISPALDSYGSVFVEAIRRHVLLLKDRVNNLCKQDSPSPADDKANYQSLVECIRTHKYLLDLYGLIGPILSFTIFFQFVFCGAVLGLAMINLVAFAEGAARFGIISYVIAVSMQSFPLCYFCNCLVDDCNDLSDALFHSSWQDQPQRYQKSVLQFLNRLQKPMKFTALNIFDINLATNINVAKFALTVYAITKGMNLDEKLRKYKEM